MLALIALCLLFAQQEYTTPASPLQTQCAGARPTAQSKRPAPHQ